MEILTNPLLQSFGGGTLAVALFAIWGFWDRARQSNKENREGVLSERQMLSADMKNYIEGLEREKKYFSEELDGCRTEIETMKFNFSNLWEAINSYRQIVHDIRHEAIRIVFRLSLQYGFDTKAAENKIPEIPNFQDIYHETKRRKEEGK